MDELLALEPDARERLLAMRLGYTEVPGSEELRAAIAGGYERGGADDVLTLLGAAPRAGALARDRGLRGRC